MPKIPGAEPFIKGLFSDTLEEATTEGIKAQRTLRDDGSEVLQNSFRRSQEAGASAEEAFKDAEYSINIRKKQAALSAKKFEELDSQVIDTTDATNLMSPAFRANSDKPNADMRKNSISGILKGGMTEIDKELSTRLFSNISMDNLTNVLGFDEKAQQQFIRAVIDPTAPADPKYKRMAEAWKKTNKMALDMYQKEGGNMQELTTLDFFPQTHDLAKMQTVKVKGDSPAVARERWVQFAKEQIDYAKMKMQHATPKEINKMLNEVYETIVSGGLNKFKAKVDNLKRYEKLIKEGKTKEAQRLKEKSGIKDGEKLADLYKDFNVKSMLANKNATKHRNIHFTADGWLKYQQEYGSKDVYKTMEDYIDGMSTDISMMQILGPNPENVWNKLIDKVSKTDKSKGSKEFVQGMYDVASGKTDKSTAESTFETGIEAVGGGYRSLGVASDLLSATIASFTDVMTSAAASGLTGQGRLNTFLSHMGTIGRRMANSFSVSEKELYTQRLGISMNTFMSSVRNNRFSESGGPLFLQKVAEFGLRASGLMAWTEAGRGAFALELSGLMADNFGKQLKDFEFGKQLIDNYGFTQEQWDKIGKKYITDLEGVVSFKEGESYIDITKLYVDHPDLALRVNDVISQESHYAVIMPDSRVRSVTTAGGASKGTVKGELGRSVWMYKSFPIAMYTTQIGRMLGDSMSAKQKFKYGTTFILGGAIMGMGTVQLMEILKGRDPIPVGDPFKDPTRLAALFLKGLMKSGGMSIFGDLIFSDSTRYGGGMVSTAVGKAGQPLEDIDTIKKLMQGDNVKASDVVSDVTRLASNYVPGRNLWYTRLMYERIFKDNLMQLVDPDFNKKLRKHKRKLRKDTGQGYWSEPGTNVFTESRLPE